MGAAASSSCSCAAVLTILSRCLDADVACIQNVLSPLSSSYQFRIEEQQQDEDETHQTTTSSSCCRVLVRNDDRMVIVLVAASSTNNDGADACRSRTTTTTPTTWCMDDEEIGRIVEQAHPAIVRAVGIRTADKTASSSTSTTTGNDQNNNNNNDKKKILQQHYRFYLPGGAEILLLPSSWASSREGRQALAAAAAASALPMPKTKIMTTLNNTPTTTAAAAKEEDAQHLNGSGGAGVVETRTVVDQKDGIKSSDDEDDAAKLRRNETISSSSTSNKKNSDANLPKFPSLQLKLVELNGKRRNLPLNLREPIDTENNLFKGKVLVLARPTRPELDDPYWNERVFAKKKRRLVIQIQGKFKYVPKGVVYAGAEVSDQMKLGLVTRGLCKLLLKLTESFTKNVHSSFGNDNNSECPHIVAPAYTFFQRIVVTPPGETPPCLDEPFPESVVSVAHRQKTDSTGTWNTTDTYSFSFYSMYIDLPTWQLVGLPASGDLSLKTFWGKSLLRICMYEKTGNGEKHLQANNRYAFCVQAKFLGKHGRELVEEGGDFDGEDSDEEENDIIAWSERRHPSMMVQQSNPSIDRSESQLFPETPSEQSDGDSLDRSERQLYPILSETAEHDNGMLFFDAAENYSGDEDIEATQSSLDSTVEQRKVSRNLSNPKNLLATIDRACPFWIDLCRNASYTRAFAFNNKNKNQTEFRPERACVDLMQSGTGGAEELVKAIFSPRLSPAERLRRSLGVAMTSDEPLVPADRLASFRQQPARAANEFLRRESPSVSRKERERVLMSGFVARALSDRHWIEECAQLTGRAIYFHHPEKRKSAFRVALSNVVGVEKLSSDLRPYVLGYHYLVLTTAGRKIYLMVASEKEVGMWIEAIDSVRFAQHGEESASVSSNDTASSRYIEVDDLAEEFLHKSSMFSCKNRRILNCGSLCFRQDPSTSSDLRPAALAVEALDLALNLPTEETEEFERRREFLDLVANLKFASVEALDAKSRLAFFLNLYHIMLSHAYLVLGPPEASLRWLTYFNLIAYQVGDDIFSLTELEHCIIRANMSFPTQFLSRFVIPKSKYRMACAADYRINFALNCGSLSNPPRILVYRAETLNDQLDKAARMYLSRASYRRTSSGDLELSLPRICQWFIEDFGHSKENLLVRIERFLPDDIRNQLAGCWLPVERKFDMNSCEIRYLPYNFECRKLAIDR